MSGNNKYTSALKGWAIDRALSLKGKDDSVTAEDVVEASKVFLEWCYCPEEEIDALRSELSKLEAEQEYRAAKAVVPATMVAKAASNG